jgi:hypothetical protein
VKLGVSLPIEMTPRQHTAVGFFHHQPPRTTSRTNVWFHVMPTLVPIMTGGRFTRARDAAARDAAARDAAAREAVARALAPVNASDAVAVASHDPTASTAPAGDIVNEASAPAGVIVEEALAPVVTTGHAQASVQACTVQCTWSLFVSCSANLSPLSLATNAAPSCIMFARSTGNRSTHTRHLDVRSIAHHIMSISKRSRQIWEILSRRHRCPWGILLRRHLREVSIPPCINVLFCSLFCFLQFIFQDGTPPSLAIAGAPYFNNPVGAVRYIQPSSGKNIDRLNQHYNRANPAGRARSQMARAPLEERKEDSYEDTSDAKEVSSSS